MRKIVKDWSQVDPNSPHNLYTIQRLAPSELSHWAEQMTETEVNLRLKQPIIIPEDLVIRLRMPHLLAWDIVHNFNRFYRNLGTPDSPAELRVQSHQKDSCRLFHGDNVLARMIITYFGPSTEDVDDDNVNREEIGTEWASFEDYNCRVLKDREKVNLLEPLYIHVLFGEQSKKLPRIHRAPDIENKGLKRFTAIGTIW